MNTLTVKLLTLSFGTAMLVACSSNPVIAPENEVAINSVETLHIYPDGRMLFNNKFINEDDVIIYNAGNGQEKAAVKVRTPIHPDFYRDSIIVVRVEKVGEDSISQTDTPQKDGIN